MKMTGDVPEPLSPGMHEKIGQEPPSELPPNRPPGILGEAGLNVMKTDAFEPDGMNAGLVQESSFETRLLSFALAYVLFFPLAFVMVWRSKRLSRRAKVVISVVMATGVAVVALSIRW